MPAKQRGTQRKSTGKRGIDKALAEVLKRAERQRQAAERLVTDHQPLPVDSLLDSAGVQEHGVRIHMHPDKSKLVRRQRQAWKDALVGKIPEHLRELSKGRQADYRKALLGSVPEGYKRRFGENFATSEYADHLARGQKVVESAGKGGRARAKYISADFQQWQTAADAIWARRPTLKKSAVAQLLSKQFNVPFNTVRKKFTIKT